MTSQKSINILKIAKKLGIKKNQCELFGEQKIKLKNINLKQKGKLVLVTAINPLGGGEGKTTISIGLADSLNLLGKKCCLALREPSLGPTFGIKGGAVGGGKSVIVPENDINLHFNGDFHAITSANNLLCALIDNHIFQGNQLEIDPQSVCFHRCLDMNDRELRNVTLKNGRKEEFIITSASEIMAIMCFSENIEELKQNLANIIVGKNKKGENVYAKDLKAEGAMSALLIDALKVNLVKTKYNTPAIVHLGPFANIAHGCNSNLATKTALALASYCVTEAGFGADLGAQKFLDVKCKKTNLNVDCAVVVATLSAIKKGLTIDDICKNLITHIENLRNVYSLPVVVAINQFEGDSEEYIEYIKKQTASIGIKTFVCTSYKDGNTGAVELAKQVDLICKTIKTKMTFCYNETDSTKTKIKNIATKIYRAKKVEYSEVALQKLEEYKKLKYPVIIAKPQQNLSDDKDWDMKKNYNITINDIQLRNGAKYLLAITKNTILMPALSKTPNACDITTDENGNIIGLK